MDKSFISIDGKQPINLNYLISVESGFGHYVIDKYYIRFIYPETSSGQSIFWVYNDQEERQKAYNFLVKKIAVCYSSENAIKSKIRKMKEKVYEKFISVVKDRRVQFKALENKNVLLLDHSAIKNRNFDNVTSVKDKKDFARGNGAKKRLHGLLKGITNYYG